MNKKSTLKMTRAALIAALYVALTYVSAAFGLSSGAIQVRISEMLCIMPIFFPEAVVGLTLGCFLSNLLTGSVIMDIIFGSVATLIGALGALALAKLPEKLKWSCTLPTVIANAIIVPFVLMYAYGAPESYWFLMLTVGAGEIIAAGICGSILYYAIRKNNFLKK